MATMTLVGIYRDLANKPVAQTRQMEHVIERIKVELVRRAKAAAVRFGIRLQ